MACSCRPCPRLENLIHSFDDEPVAEIHAMKPPFDVCAILIGGITWAVLGAGAMALILFVVGETVEHFSP